MNSFDYNEIQIGQQASFECEVSAEYVDCFRKHTGDINPLHQNKEFAINKGFSDKVVFGMLTASYYSTLVGVHLPGEKCFIHSVDSSFLKPVETPSTMFAIRVLVRPCKLL